MSADYANLSAEEALQAIARIFEEGTDSDGWDIGILEEVFLVLTERGLAIDTDDEAVPNTGMSQSAMLRHHLEHNHFPPLDFETWGAVAQAAIDAVERRALDDTLQTPAGFHSVQSVMDNLHLWDFVTSYDEDA